jgi:hypothetical protein
MPSEFTIKVDIDTVIPNFMDADIPLKQIAEKVVTDSQRNIRQQTMPDGRDFEALSRKTIKDKIREGAPYPRRALYRKGIMYRAIHAYRIGKNQYEVGVIPRGKPQRDQIAAIHSGIGGSFNLPVRRFLGMSQATRDWANARMLRWINENIRKAAHKFINLKY